MIVMPARGGRWAVAATAAAVMALSGCSPSEQPSEDASSTTTSSAPGSSAAPTTPTLSSAEREARDRAAVEEAWLNYWGTQDLLTTPDPGVPESEWYELISQYAVEAAARQDTAGLQDVRRQGLVGYGNRLHQLSWEAAITGADVAQLFDCQDDSQAGLMNPETGEKVTAGQANKRVEGQLVRGADGQWRVQQVIYRSEPC